MIFDELLGGFAATEAADQEREMQRDNLNRFYADRDLLFKKFDESRGSGGNAFLPLYFGSGDDSFERQIANDYRDLYNRTAVNPAKQIQQYKQIQGQYMPMIEAGRGAAMGIFDGNLTNSKLQNAQPVFQARQNAAATQKQGVLEGLQERLNALNAASAKSGYTGTGSFAQNRLLGATIGARQQAAEADASAQLANAMDQRSILDSGLDLKLANLNLPYQLSSNEFQFQDMPTKAVLGAYLDRIRPMDAFRIGTAMPNVPFTPTQQAIPSDSQIWLQTSANIAHNIGELAKAYFSGGMSGMGGGGGSTPMMGASYVQPQQQQYFTPQANPSWNFTL